MSHVASQHLAIVLNIQHDNRLNDENKHLLMVRTDASCPIFSLYRPIVLHLTGTVKVDTRAQMTCENYSWSSSRTAADALVRMLGLLPYRSSKLCGQRPALAALCSCCVATAILAGAGATGRSALEITLADSCTEAMHDREKASLPEMSGWKQPGWVHG